MKKVIIITGPRGSGKSTKARELTKGMKTANLYVQTFKKRKLINLQGIEKDTEAIIIDEVMFLNEVAPFIYLPNIIVEKQYQSAFIFELPTVIIVTSNLKFRDISARPNFQFIDLAPLT